MTISGSNFFLPRRFNSISLLYYSNLNDFFPLNPSYGIKSLFNLPSVLPTSDFLKLWCITESSMAMSCASMFTYCPWNMVLLGSNRLLDFFSYSWIFLIFWSFVGLSLICGCSRKVFFLNSYRLNLLKCLK